MTDDLFASRGVSIMPHTPSVSAQEVCPSFHTVHQLYEAVSCPAGVLLYMQM
ncbi:MAG: hypothetical protein ACLT4C_09270 [Butyricicoccus sp.]